jgi:phosphomannomutase
MGRKEPVRSPMELRFGTSGLRGLVRDMTDREVYVNVRGWLDYLRGTGELEASGAVGEDLREVDPRTGLSSSPRISRAVMQAVRDAGYRVVNCGKVPTPALASFAMARDPRAEGAPMPGVMVTGSHIPADRNGVKFYGPAGEVLKSEEAAILESVRRARTDTGPFFDGDGMFREHPPTAPVEPACAEGYAARFLGLYPGEEPLAGMKVVLYEHSSVARDLAARVLRELGASVIRAGRSETFVPVDTEDVSAEDEELFREYAERFQPDAIVSLDGDGDRPLVVDEKGRFHRGDVLGLICAEFLGVRVAAVPISTSDALDLATEEKVSRGEEAIALRKTRIGSPHVIAAMEEALAEGFDRVAGWEANGGFLTASDFLVNGRLLRALPTRDGLLPILAALLRAAREKQKLSELFASLPPRATRSGLLDDFPIERSRELLASFKPAGFEPLELSYRGGEVELSGEWTGPPTRADDRLTGEALRCRARLARYFSPQEGFGGVRRINYLDGVRVFFENGDIAHLRPSGNAPQLRIYAVSDTEARAEAIVQLALREPDGILRRMERGMEGG